MTEVPPPTERYVMVLNDGETYICLSGCLILRIDAELLDHPDLDGIVKETARLSNLGWRTSADRRVEIVTEYR